MSSLKKSKNTKTSATGKKNRPRNIQQSLEESMTPLDRVMDKLTNSIETGHRHPYLIDHEVGNFDLGNVVNRFCSIRPGIESGRQPKMMMYSWRSV